MKKILFVTHTLEGLYGASTSLRLLLENYEGVEADLLLPRSFRNPRDLAATAARFACVKQVYEISLPVDLALLGIRGGLADRMHGMLHGLSWRKDRAKFRQLLQEKNYDIVHFNSPVLHQMLAPGIPAVTHMRDIILDPSSPVIDKLAESLGLVFIDTATRKPFARREASLHGLTLNNPIDMRAVGHTPPLRHERITPDATVFSVIGRIAEIKGVSLVVEAFRRAGGGKDVLLIVGAGAEPYVQRCRAAAQNDPRIIFWGEEENVDAVYAATDYVVRGDPAPCIGRTVYEGLYSGCRVILPGPPEPDLIFEAERFATSLIFYKAGDAAEMAQAFANCRGKKIQAREYRGNIEDYVKSFDAFLDTCVERFRKAPR